MRLKYHVLASTVTSAVYGYFFHSWTGTLACFFSGILIDLDHVLDYQIIKKKFWITLKELEDYCFHNREGRIYLIFHSYELLLILWVTTQFFSNPTWVGLIFGMTVHMLFDQFTNGTHPLAYFWCFRARYGFLHKIFFKEIFERDILRVSNETSKV